MKIYSPLRYPGGKSVLYKYISAVIDDNNLNKYTYIELFAGGAGLGIALLLNNKVRDIVINDLDYCIYSFWNSVLNETEELCEKIKHTSVTIEERAIQKDIYDNPDIHSCLNVGFATLFLNRTNRSGILRGGVIGGKNQTGNYLIDCRFNKIDIIHRIQSIAEYREQITLFNMNASEFLETQDEVLRRRCFLYLDPPYVVKGGNLYKNAFNQEDHAQLAKMVKSRLRSRKWIITYDNDSLIDKLYQSFRREIYKLSYTANEKKKGSEVMIFSPTIGIPQQEIIQITRR
jgi:DNA adenine methylase